MEAHVNAVEDHLIESLQFKLPPGASYVVDRRYVTYFPSGGNSYSPVGVKVIKIPISGDNWLDPSSVKLFFTLTNTTATAGNFLKPLSGPWCFIRRWRTLCGGQVIEDIDYYHRTYEMFHQCLPAEKRINDEIEYYGDTDPNNETIGKANVVGEIPAAANALDKNNRRNVMFSPLSGLLNQPKYLPLRYCPITFEIEIVGNYEDAVKEPGATGGTAVSTEWDISNVQVKCDILTLDNGLDNEYASHLLSGKTLPISFNSYITQVQSTVSSQTDFSVNVSRAITRLKSIFVSLYRDEKTGTDNSTKTKECNYFYHPMRGGYRFDREIEFQIQIGSKLMPEYPIRSLAEAFSHLRKALGILSSSFPTLNMTVRKYSHNQFFIGIDTEKVISAGYTGLNTRAGDLMSLRFKNCGDPNDANNTPQRLYTTLHYDAVLTLTESGVMILD